MSGAAEDIDTENQVIGKSPGVVHGPRGQNAADQPCPTCGGSGEEANIYLGPTDHRCPDC